jgi:hypothetical protein
MTIISPLAAGNLVARLRPTECPDAVLTASLPAGLITFFALSTVVGFHISTTGTNTEFSPNVIRPADCAAGSNERLWKVATMG